jgi:hypothetical protein
MKSKYDNIFWGILLILAAGLTLAQQQGWVDALTTQFWMLAFGGLALVFFVRYLLAGFRHWGWLFPTCVFLAISGMIWLGDSGYRDSWIAAPLFGGLAIPFLVAFSIDVRKHWWALIPAFVMLVLGGVVVFAEQAPGEIIGASFMFAIAIPFLAVYFSNRNNWWALIPGFIMAAIGALILMSTFLSEWAGAFITLMISLPFFYIYLRDNQHWWALIPAGIMASISLNVFLTLPFLGRFAESTIPSGVMFLGWAATFAWLWKTREKTPTAWARIPALVCTIIAAILLIVGSLTELGLTVALVMGGLILIYFGLRPRKDKMGG